MTTTNTHATAARDSLAAARSAHDALSEAYRDRTPNAGEAAALHTAIKYGLKAADVEATLAIAEEVAALRAALTAGVPSQVELTRRLLGKPEFATLASSMLLE